MDSCSSRISSTPALSVWPTLPVLNLALRFVWLVRIVFSCVLLVGRLRVIVQASGLATVVVPGTKVLMKPDVAAGSAPR